MAELPHPFLFRLLWWVEDLEMCSESLGSEKVSYGPCAHQESCESLAAMAKFLVIRFDRSVWYKFPLTFTNGSDWTQASKRAKQGCPTSCQIYVKYIQSC